MKSCGIQYRLMVLTLIIALFLSLNIELINSVYAATWTGRYCQGGHWTSLPITFKFVDPGDKCTTTNHPGRGWTEAEKNVARAAIREYNDADSGLYALIMEETDRFKVADITLRWEYETLSDGTQGFFRDWHNDNTTHPRFCNWERLSQCTTGYWNGPRGDESTWIPEGQPDPNGCRPFPQNEIYLNANKTWFVDPTPGADEEFDSGGYMLNPNQLDLYTVIKHEFGHALGLSTHSTNNSDVMATSGDSSRWVGHDFYYRRRRLTKGDIGLLQGLYGKHSVTQPYRRYAPQGDTYYVSPTVHPLGHMQLLYIMDSLSAVYLKINMSLCPSGVIINSAKIWLYLNNTDGVAQNLAICEVSDSWDEDTLIKENAPPPGGILNTITVNSSGWYGWSITEYAKQQYTGDKLLSVAIKSLGPGNKGFLSREAPRGDSVYRADGSIPHLEIEYDGIIGDINGDGKVDIVDIATIAKAYGSYPGHPRWNPKADLNGDGIVNIIDIAKAAKNFGKEA